MKKIVSIFIIAILVILLVSNSIAISETTVTEYTESIEEFENPDIGFYTPTFIKCEATGDWKNTKISNPSGLVHLRFGIGSFSSKVNGEQDYDITAEHIEKLNEYMEQVRSAGGTAIIRFAYDDFEGTANLEPDITVVLKHIEQLQPFFEANKDVITLVETGFLGPWGEQHTSTIVTQENMNLLVQALLESVPTSRTINVRRPLYYAWFTGISINTINENVSTENSDAYRIGIFNDGYLGSSSDLGTFSDRSIEIAWLKNQATHTIYGGEAVISSSDVDENGYLYNSPEHITEEMFETHTSYLNSLWNDTLIQSWKDTTYTGDDVLYQNSSAYTYIKNHLGYRLVLTETELPTQIEQSSAAVLNISLKNVGAGNIVNKKTTYVLLKNDTSEYYIETNLDARNWLSEENYNLDVNISISSEMNTGDYEVYLKIVDSESDASSSLRTIRFANNEDVWNSDLGANKIGNLTIVAKSQTQGNNTNTSNTENSQNTTNNTNTVDNSTTENTTNTTNTQTETTDNNSEESTNETQLDATNTTTESTDTESSEDTSNTAAGAESSEEPSSSTTEESTSTTSADETVISGTLPNTGKSKHKFIICLIGLFGFIAIKQFVMLKKIKKN